MFLCGVDAAYRVDTSMGGLHSWFLLHRFPTSSGQVLKCCYTTLVWSPSYYLSANLTPAADLYGPFWTLTALILCLYVSSSLVYPIESSLSGEPIDYDFSLLSTAFALVYVCGLGRPALFQKHVDK